MRTKFKVGDKVRTNIKGNYQVFRVTSIHTVFNPHLYALRPVDYITGNPPIYRRTNELELVTY